MNKTHLVMALLLIGGKSDFSANHIVQHYKTQGMFHVAL